MTTPATGLSAAHAAAIEKAQRTYPSAPDGPTLAQTCVVAEALGGALTQAQVLAVLAASSAPVVVGGAMPSTDGLYWAVTAFSQVNLSASDFPEIMLAGKADGFAGCQYDFGFVAATGDVDTNTGGAAVAGSLQFMGGMFVQIEDSTVAQTIDWGITIAGGINNFPLGGNAAGDVGLGMITYDYSGNSAGNPTLVSAAGVFVKGSTRQVGMGTVTPNASALLDMASTTRGFAPPRMTTAQRDAIASPTEGLIVANITTHKIDFYNGSAWGPLT